MDEFSVDTHLGVDDWRAYQRAFQRRLIADRHPLRTFLLVVAGSLLLGFIGAAYMQHAHRPLHVSEIIAGMLLAYLSIAIRAHMAQRAAVPLPDGAVLGATRYHFTPEGIRQQRALTQVQMAWSALQDISVTPQHLFLWIDRIAAYIVPVRDLPPSLTAESAAAVIRALAQAGTGMSAAPSASASTEPAGIPMDAGPAAAMADAAGVPHASVGDEGSLPASLQDALRVCAFLPLRAGVAVHQAATLLLAIAAIAAWIGLDGFAQDQPTKFSALGLNGIAWYLLAALAVAWFMAARADPPLPVRNTVWIIAVIAPLAVLGTWLASFKDLPWSALILALTAMITAGAAARALSAMTGESQWRAVTGGLAASLLLWAVTGALLVSATVWYPLDSDEDADAPSVDIEASLYEQPARIDAAVAAVAAHSGNAPQAYMLGFAGVGEQRVFAEEIQLAARVLGRRYGSAERSLLLINDERDLESHPLATVTALARALRGMAQRMNPQEDILFLVLSSHGSQDASIAVSNGSMELNQLDADSLADALQDSGIRNKVIIISACYAGGFVPALSDENTIILAAAAADRTSFGCGNDRDLTYFGEAFFRDALPGAPSLQAAFTRAADMIARRELAEHETPSKPQAFFGAKITARLAALEQANAAQPRLTAGVNP